MRERAAMRFYQRMGLPAPREAHVALFVNNNYAGLYAVVEEIDKDLLARVFGRNGTGVENDGYLFEYRWTTEWYFTSVRSRDPRIGANRRAVCADRSDDPNDHARSGWWSFRCCISTTPTS
jgi:hypothetical protein